MATTGAPDDGPTTAPTGVGPGPATDPRTGLTTAEAAARLARDGPNTLPRPARTPAWRQLVGQLTHFFALMLWLAGLLALVAQLTALGVAIFAVVVLNGLFAFAQEFRAERAAERLDLLLPRRVLAVRDGVVVDLDADDLVVGDVVRLEAGDRVPADLRVVAAHGLEIDTSMLTGESVPDAVDVGGPALSGTFLVEGEATAVVVATGGRTRLAEIAALTQAGTRPRSPLATELHRVVRIIATVAVVVGTSFFLLALALGTDPAEGIVFGIGVTVALVPEGLLPTVTLSLAIGAQRMAREDALVRRLESVETLGSTTFICTDKTGTLTRNTMQAVEVWTPVGVVRVKGEGYDPTADLRPSPGGDEAAILAALRRAARIGARTSTGHAVLDDGVWQARGDPMEAALDVLDRRAARTDDGSGDGPDDGPGDEADDRELVRFPFDPRRRRMSVVTPSRVLVKGAPDALLLRCAPVAGRDEALAAMTERGLRVLAVADRDRTPGEPVPADAGEAESDLVLRGLVGLEDPPRAAAPAALAACREAGIRVAMVTGDHPATARAIAGHVGLWQPGAPVVTGPELPDDLDALGELLDRDGAVVARVTPEDKLRIAAALQRRGHVVAMTGDGVNDGPALQEADIGIAMGASGTDVAREAADLVLLDDDFATIVVAVEQGRATFRNIRRFLTYHLTDNVAELTPFVVWALSGGRIPLALTVLQVLALDIGTDTLPAVALGAEPPRPEERRRGPAQGHLLDRGVAGRAFGVLGPTEAVMEMAAFVVTYLVLGWRPGSAFPEGDTLAAASGAAFVAVVAGQLANAFACRSTTRWPGALGWSSNRFLVGAVVIEVAVAASFLFIPPIADLLRQAVPPLEGWVVALAAAPALLGVDAAVKAARRRRLGRPPPAVG